MNHYYRVFNYFPFLKLACHKLYAFMYTMTLPIMLSSVLSDIIVCLVYNSKRAGEDGLYSYTIDKFESHPQLIDRCRNRSMRSPAGTSTS